MRDRARRSAMKSEQLLEQAAAVVAQRRGEYGEPVDLFEQIAKRWSFVLGVEVAPAQAVLCMIEVKLARLSRNPKQLDSIVDIAGYAAILAELAPDA